MINESISGMNGISNSFFDAKSGKANSKNSDSSYDAVMKSAMNDAKKPMRTDKPEKVERLKVSNKESLMTEQTMPSRTESVVNNDRSVSDLDEKIEDNEFAKKLVKRAQTSDDQVGLMSAMFDSSKVIYPVKQIAQESLDEEVINSLMAQGLWDVQGAYVAKPSENFASVMESSQPMIPVQKPIAQFMASMENELGVSPDRLVQAYSELPEGQLVKNPVETMTEVIKKLELPPADQKKAADLYTKMLAQMQKTDQKLNIDQEAKQLLASAMLSQGAERTLAKKEMGMEDFSQNLSKVKNENVQVVSQNTQSVMPQSQMSEQGMMSENSSDEGFKQDLGKKLNTKLTPNGSELSASQGAHRAFENQIQSFNALATGEVAAANGADGKASRNEAIQNIVNNAQALSMKGGGEMKMILKPEHLGEIQLKVSTNGNQVNIQMVAEKPEAKKLLEQNIQELKHGLASHGLGMEKLDVSLNDKSGFQNQQNGKPDFNQAREFAQQFNQGQAGNQGQAYQGRSGDQKLDDLRAGRTTTRSMLKSKSQNMAMKAPERRGSSRLDVVA